MATQQLAKWASELSFVHLPADVVQAAIRSLHNSFGSILGGSSHATTQGAINAFKCSSSDICTLLGQQGSLGGPAGHVDVHTAALINGISSHVHDYDDTHLHTVIHPAGAVLVSLLAFAEHLRAQGSDSPSISGKQFITALVAGVEVGLRVGNAVTPNHYSEGWHITGTVSPIAVAAGLSNMLQLTTDQTVNAIGLASAQPVGIRVHFGTDTKPFHAGRAAQNGIMAVVLAREGFTAAPDALEGRRGWIEVLGNGSNTLDEQVEQLLRVSQSRTSPESELWEIEKNTFKPFPCGIVIHPTIDACIQLHNEHEFIDPDNLSKIKSIYLRVHPLVLDLTGKKTPKDGLEAKFSVYHGAAIGLALGSATPTEYTDEVVNNDDVLAIRSKVVAEVDESIRSDEAVVTLHFQDGSKTEKHVEHAVGSLDRPMTDKELKEKFLEQAVPVLGKQRAEALEDMAWDVVNLPDVCEIVKAAA